MPAQTPAYDNKIYQKYSKNSLPGKEKNKVAFCQDFGLKYNKKTPLLCLTFPLTKANNMSMMKDVIGGILEQNVMIAVTGIGTEEYQEFFNKLAEANPQRVAILPDNPENKRKIYAASDILLCTCTTKECMIEIEGALNYGVVPVAPECETVQDYNGSKEEGYAFVYAAKSPWSFFASLIRAMENFKFPYDWKTIQKNAMTRNDEGDEGEADEEELA